MGIQSVPALAATKNISSVSVRVGTDTELGEVLPSNIVTFDDSLEAHDGTYAATNSTKYYVLTLAEHLIRHVIHLLVGCM